MVNTERFLESATAQRLPSWIRQHKVLTSNKTLKKVFPSLGLENSIEDIKHPDVKNAKLVFSSEGYTGLWDLATMSMRGVMSCMHWENDHSKHLIGSMIDPVCGMLYITDGKMTDYGLSIIKRALVRVAVRDGDPYLFVDRIYARTRNTNPNIYSNYDRFYYSTAKIFENYLKHKTKLPVYVYQTTLQHDWIWTSVIPQARIVTELHYGQRSLVDSRIPYSRRFKISKEHGDWRNLLD